MNWRRLLVPTLMFVIFLSIAQLGGGLLSHIARGVSTTQLVAEYVVNVGLWLSGAALAVRLTDVIIWDRVRGGGNTVPRLLVDLVAALYYGIAISCIMSVVFEKSLTGIWATSGAIGLIVGFALQSIILDVFIGLALNFERPYKIGDWIEVGDIGGRVVEINWRTTRLLREENNTVIIPNSVVGKGRIQNFTMPPEPVRFQTLITIDFSVPVERARRILHAAAISAYEKETSNRKMRPQVLIERVTELGVEYKVRYWFHPWDKMTPSIARDKVLTSVMNHLQYAGITPAYPKQDNYTALMPPRHLDSRTTEDRISLVAKNPLFEELSHPEREMLARELDERRFESGDVLIKQGDEGESMFILIEGVLDVYIDGRAGRIARMKPGKYFGEMSLLTGSPRTATVKAATDGLAFEIPKVAVTHLLEQRPEVAEMLSKVMAKHQTRSGAALEDEGEVEAEVRTSRANQLLKRITAFFSAAR